MKVVKQYGVTIYHCVSYVIYIGMPKNDTKKCKEMGLG